MKKKLALLLAVVMVVAMFGTVLAACSKDSGLTDEQLTALITGVRKFHTESNKMITNNNFNVIGAYSDTELGLDVKVSWKSSSEKVAISSQMNGAGFYAVTIPDRTQLEEDFSYTLTATLVDEDGEAYKDADGETYSTSFNHTVEPKSSKEVFLENYFADVASAPAMNTEYNLTMYYGSENYLYYFTGAMSGNYYGLDKQLSASKKVKLVAAEGGFYISFDNSGTTNYLTLVDNSAGGKNPKANVSFTTSPSTVFTVDATLNYALKATISTNLEGGVTDSDFYLGGQTSYKTMSASSSYYVTGSNAVNVDNTQGVVRLVGDKDYNGQYGGGLGLSSEAKAFRSSAVAEPVEGTAYKLAVYKTSGTLYFNGNTKSGQDYYMTTVTNKAAAQDCYIEKSGDGFYIYFTDSSSVKKYVTIVISGTHVNAQLTTEVPANGVFKMDATLKIPYMEFNSGKYLLTSDGTYNTIGGYTWPSAIADTADVSLWAMRLIPA